MSEPRRIVVWSDVSCPWAHAAVHELRAARTRLDLTPDDVVLDHRAFPLELLNQRPTSWSALHAEVPVLAGMAPAAGWSRWTAAPWEWPVTTLPALEAVQAAKLQGLAAAEQLDAALRRAFFAESRCVSLRHVLLAVARDCPGVDGDLLADPLDTGTARGDVIAQWREAVDTEVRGSPTVVLPDGEAVFNPGVRAHWLEPARTGFPVVDHYDRSAYDEIVRRAAAVS